MKLKITPCWKKSSRATKVKSFVSIYWRWNGPRLWLKGPRLKSRFLINSRKARACSNQFLRGSTITFLWARTQACRLTADIYEKLEQDMSKARDSFGLDSQSLSSARARKNRACSTSSIPALFCSYVVFWWIYTTRPLEFGQFNHSKDLVCVTEHQDMPPLHYPEQIDEEERRERRLQL